MKSYSYLIVILPPKDIIKTMDKYRRLYAKYTSYALPTHITVYPPFFLKGITEGRFLTKLKNDFSKMECGEVTLKSVDYFKGRKSVAFVKPDSKSSKYIINLLVKTVKLLNGYTKNVYSEYSPTPDKFNPHMTIAEKIPNNSLSKIKKELKNFNHVFSFRVESIFVFKKATDAKTWDMLREITFH